MYENIGNQGLIYGLIPLLIGYLIFAVHKLLKSPRKKAIIPLYGPPENLSPAAVRYLFRKGYDGKVLTSALLGLASKGQIKINQVAKDFEIEKVEEPKNEILSAEEKTILEQMDKKIGFYSSEDQIASEDRTSQTAETINYSVYYKRPEPRLTKMSESLEKALDQKFENKYINPNNGFLYLGTLWSVLMVVLGLILNIGNNFTIYFIAAVLAVLNIDIVLYLFELLVRIRLFIRRPTLNLFFDFYWPSFMAAAILWLDWFVFAALPGHYSASVFNSFILFFSASLAYFVVNYWFYKFAKTPTEEGRKLLDQIEGFKLYLSVAEKERQKFFNPPNKTPDLFGKYFPYAYALEVNKEWKNQFSDVVTLASDAAAGI